MLTDPALPAPILPPHSPTTAAKKKERSLAWTWLLSPYYRHQFVSPRGLKRMLLALAP